MSYKYISLVSDQEQYVFYKIYKSGSSTVSKILHAHTKISSLPYKKVFFENSAERLNAYHANLDLYFKFAFVRNPWDRLVSLYSDKVLNPESGLKKVPYYDQFIGLSFESFLEKIIFSDLDNCIPHHRSQSHLIPFEKMNFIGRFETLNKDLAFICERLNITNYKIGHLNKSKHAHYSTFYNDYTKRLVEVNYSEDIENFGYSFNESVHSLYER